MLHRGLVVLSQEVKNNKEELDAKKATEGCKVCFSRLAAVDDLRRLLVSRPSGAPAMDGLLCTAMRSLVGCPGSLASPSLLDVEDAYVLRWAQVCGGDGDDSRTLLCDQVRIVIPPFRSPRLVAASGVEACMVGVLLCCFSALLSACIRARSSECLTLCCDHVQCDSEYHMSCLTPPLKTVSSASLFAIQSPFDLARRSLCAV
jgi:hypothetical protein